MKINIENIFHPIINLLNENDIKYALIGGIAVLIYGEPRLTEDVDINIILEKDKIFRFIKILKKNHISPVLPHAGRIAKESGYLPAIYKKGAQSRKYDLIIAENPIELAAINRARLIRIGAQEVMVVTPEDLIIHKIASDREKDRNDLRGIILRQKGNIDLNYVTNWLRKIDAVVKNSHLDLKFKTLLKEKKSF